MLFRSGDNVLGKQLSDGNVVIVSYILTNGTASAGANNFVLMDPISGYSNNTIYPTTSASFGGDRDTIATIKYQAPKSYASQGRAVTKEDYITLIQQNQLGFNFDAVNVWGGQENDPPVYGQVFISVKPAGAYDLTQAQKNMIVNQVLKPISVVTVEPTLVDPQYTFIQVNADVIYQQSQTPMSPGTMQAAIQNSIYNYSATNLNTFKIGRAHV